MTPPGAAAPGGFREGETSGVLFSEGETSGVLFSCVFLGKRYPRGGICGEKIPQRWDMRYFMEEAGNGFERFLEK